jgi:hypothetical protein
VTIHTEYMHAANVEANYVNEKDAAEWLPIESPEDRSVLVLGEFSNNAVVFTGTDDDLLGLARTIRESITDDGSADTLVTCRQCSAELPADEPCEVSGDGEHDPDMEIHEPPADDLTSQIRVEFVLTVPNDGYDYHVDIGGRLERISARMLDDRLVTAVETSGPSGSGWAEDVEPDH